MDFLLFKKRAAPFLVLGGLWAGQCFALETMEKIFPSIKVADVRVSSIDGDMHIQTSKKKEVFVSVQQKSKGCAVTTRTEEDKKDADKTIIFIDYSQNAVVDPHKKSGCKGTIVLFLPPSSFINMQTISGDISLEGDYTSARFHTVSGDIVYKGSSRDVDIQSTSGDIVALGNSVRTRMEGVSGDISLDYPRRPKGELEIQTISGDVSVTVPKGSHLAYSLDSESGELKADGIKNHQEAPFIVHAKTISGDFSIKIK